jgi:hypothetical protein
MAHSKLRTDANCLNCGHLVEKQFCSNCGQENRVPFESVFGFTTHFIADILHWDGKFFRTLKKLFANPGALSEDYVAGKRATYVIPIRLYLICSIVFGISLSMHLKHSDEIKISASNSKEEETSEDSTSSSDFKISSKVTLRSELLNKPKELRNFDWLDSVYASKPTRVVINPFSGAITGNLGWSSTEGKVMLPFGITAKNIDSAIAESRKMTPEEEKMTNEFQYILVRFFMRKKIEHPDGNLNLNKAVIEELTKTLPKSFFVLMPLFALFLYWLYYRRKYFYYQHMVFTLHYYCVALLVYGIMPFITKYLIAGDAIPIFTILGMSVYLFIALKRFYKQSYGKTFIKFCLLSFANAVALALTVIIIFLLGLYHA